MFRKVLVANRGEIACRVIETARRMGVATVAVYSTADRDARHVLLADEAVAIGPPPSGASYLNIEAIVDACRKAGADALHPGYGFLAENARFAERLAGEGVVFIGPGPEAIAAMGDKLASKALARAAGVNTVPGGEGPVESRSDALAVAREVGYPVMVKASAGGGGRGLRVARSDAEVAEAFDACRAEALAAFGDDRVFVEKFIGRPRHIEVQVFGDSFGNVVHLGERECTLQRRHQKVLEESPSPFLDGATRAAMTAQAVALARAVNYQSAGTVEFVVGGDRRFYFLEMNTRLQVEHPVTEMVTGLDLVELMIRVAAGERLPFTQDEVRHSGWSIECRINAEDPARGFLPSVGRLVRYRAPAESPGAVRVDTGAKAGGEISAYYDSMIAKVVTHGADRAEAIGRMREALDAFVIRGVSSNLAFQSAVLRRPKFVAGDFDTGFIAEEFPGGYDPSAAAPVDEELIAAAAAHARRSYVDRAGRIGGQIAGRGRVVGDDWVVRLQGRSIPLRLLRTEGGADATFDGRARRLRTDWKLGDILMTGEWDETPFVLQVERLGLRYRLARAGGVFEVTVMTPRAAELLALMPEKPPRADAKLVLSPMPGLLAEVAVKAGQAVRAGEPVVVIEAMKMRNVVRAETDGVVDEILVELGESLSVDQPVVRFR